MTTAGQGSGQAVTNESLLELVSTSALFASLGTARHDQIAETLVRLDVAARTEIVRRGDSPAGIYLIESGRVAATVKNIRSGTTQILAAMGRGHCFGQNAALLGAPSEADYVALDPSVVYRMPKAVFDAYAEQVPAFSHALARELAIDRMDFAQHGAIAWVDTGLYAFDEQLWACLPATVATEARLCPLSMTGDVMTVAMVNPRDVSSLDRLSAALPDVRFRVVACSEEDLRTHLTAYRQQRRAAGFHSQPPLTSSPPSFRFTADEQPSVHDGKGKGSVFRTASASTPPPAVSVVEEIVGVGLGAGASDIHIEPERSGVVVRYRVNGQLHRRRDVVDGELARAIVNRLKTLSRLDITETRRPQDGRISVAMADGRAVDLRISTVPAKFGEKIALRVLDSVGAITDLKALFPVDQVRNLFARMLARRTGFILVTGPTGGGKSTTMYSALNASRAQNVNIMTVEDPIEYHLDGVTQVEVHPEAGSTFATILRALLRQDPNIILVGEMRDEETARIAVEASLTGHLVLSSLHTNGTLEAIARLRGMGISSYALANGLVSILHQRLVQRTCSHCAEPFSYSPSVIESLVRLGALSPGSNPSLMRGAGCETCNGSGLSGRIAVYGMLLVNDEVRQAIGREADLDELRTIAGKNAHITLARYAGALLRMGLTVPGEILPILSVVEA